MKKNNGEGYLASDSRVTWIDNQSGLPVKWFDSPDFLKNLSIDNVMYGFAGANVMFKLFLQKYTTQQDSEFLLDTLVLLAKKERIQFFIIRYDGFELKLFGYSPPNLENNSSPEILRNSFDPSIESNTYAIGSGKYSKEYKKHRMNKNAQLPIRKIITANQLGLKKLRMLDLEKKAAMGTMTLDESRDAYMACQKKGGDLFTGGEINMSKVMTLKQINEQVEIMDSMDKQAKAIGAVCSSPINACLEVKQLNSIGQYAVSHHSIEKSAKRSALFDDMQQILHASI